MSQNGQTHFVSDYFGTLYIIGLKLDYEICTQKSSW